MKYIFAKTVVFCLIILATGCGKDFLDRNNPGDLSYDKVYKSQKDFEAALAGCYQANKRTVNYKCIPW